MKNLDLLSSAVSNTFRSKLRTTLTVMALFIGAFTLTLTTAVGAGVTEYVTKQVSALGANDVFIISAGSGEATGDGPQKYDPEKSSTATGVTPGPSASNVALKDANIDELRSLKGLSEVEPIRSVAFDYIQFSESEQFQFAVNPTSSIGKSDLLAGMQLSSTTSESQVMLPSDYLDALGFSSAESAVGKTVTLGLTDILGQRHEIEASVAGVARESLLASGAGANRTLTTKAADIQQAGINTANNKYSFATAKFDSSLNKDAVAELKNDVTSAGYTVQTIEDQLGVITSIIGGIVGILNAFAIIALLAAAFGIVNTLLMSVQERTREIGLMKAMGMGARRVFALFSLEAIFIGFLGSSIGALAAVGVGTGLSAFLAAGPLADLPGLNILLFEPMSIVGIILLIMAIAFLSGTLPARRAANQNPIESLRYE